MHGLFWWSFIHFNGIDDPMLFKRHTYEYEQFDSTELKNVEISIYKKDMRIFIMWSQLLSLQTQKDIDFASIVPITFNHL